MWKENFQKSSENNTQFIFNPNTHVKMRSLPNDPSNQFEILFEKISGHFLLIEKK